MNELIFAVEEDAEGGYQARALGESIFTEGDTLEELYSRVRDAVQCHFDPGQNPETRYLHFTGSRFDSAFCLCNQRQSV